MLKISEIILKREGPSDDSKFETPPIATRCTRATSTIKRKLEWTSEETGGTPKRNIDEEYSSSSRMKSAAKMMATNRRKECTGILGFHVSDEVAKKMKMSMLANIESGVVAWFAAA